MSDISSQNRLAVWAWLGIALLLAGCARFTYKETPTAAPQSAPSPTALPAPTATPLPEPSPTPEPEGPTILRLEPATVPLSVGEVAPVEVWLDNAEQLNSIELHISFEPGYVHVEDSDPEQEGVQIGSGVMPIPAQVLQNEVDNDAGLIVYHVVKDPDSIGSRSGTVASFTVRALAEGGSPLRFNVATLLDAAGQPLPEPALIDGLVIIGAAANAPPPASAATPIPSTPAAATPAAAVTPVPAPVPANPAAETGVYYTVQRGENLFRIALRYGVTVDAIVAANGLSNRGLVYAGQMLFIPANPPIGRVVYVVQPGDTLYSLARRFNTTVETLVALNGIDSSSAIRVGQTLVVAP